MIKSKLLLSSYQLLHEVQCRETARCMISWLMLVRQTLSSFHRLIFFLKTRSDFHHLNLWVIDLIKSLVAHIAYIMLRSLMNRARNLIEQREHVSHLFKKFTRCAKACGLFFPNHMEDGKIILSHYLWASKGLKYLIKRKSMMSSLILVIKQVSEQCKICQIILNV